MEFAEILEKGLEKVSAPFQMMNEKWDNIHPSTKTIVTGISFLLGILVTGRAFMFLAVIIICLIRVFYHEGIFKEDEKELPIFKSEDDI
jgi:hypothetical protein